MANSVFQFSGQSVANLSPPQSFQTFQAGVGNPPPTPDRIAAGAANAGAALVYPSDRPKYFMHFLINKYTRVSLTEVGTLEPWAGGPNEIVLPLSEGLADNLEGRWEARPLPWVIGGVLEAVQGLKQQNLLSMQQQDAQNRLQAGRNAAIGAL